MQVHHLCGQRACIRIDHLELATPAENMRKGANVKLDVEKVRAIRADPRVARAVAAEYGVSAHTIRAVRNPKRRMWMDA